jgi:hypothetical protein
MTKVFVINDKKTAQKQGVFVIIRNRLYYITIYLYYIFLFIYDNKWQKYKGVDMYLKMIWKSVENRGLCLSFVITSDLLLSSPNSPAQVPWRFGSPKGSPPLSLVQAAQNPRHPTLRKTLHNPPWIKPVGQNKQNTHPGPRNFQAMCNPAAVHTVRKNK